MSRGNWLPSPPIGVGIVVALLLALTASQNWQQDPKNGDGRAGQEATNTHRIVDDTGLPVIRGIQTPKANRQPDRNEWRSENDLQAQWEAANWTKYAAIAAWFGTIIAFIGIWFIWRTLKANVDAVQAATRAAVAAEASVAVAEDTAKRQLRAYLAVVGCSIEETDSGFTLSAILKNTGQTPAFNTRVMAESFGGPYPLQAEKPHPAPDGQFGATIGAAAEMHTVQRIFTDTPKAVLENLKTGKFGLWIQGTCTYEDCFNAPHTTKFRYVFGGRLADSDGFALHADREGNEAD